MEKAYIALASGQVFEGYRFGADVDSVGELVFTTGMGGYVETLTDPSYFGQIVLQTFPLIGNYGMIAADMESNGSFLKGYVVREWCEHPSNFRCEGTIDTYLKEQGVPGIYGVDTREITKIIREHGVVNAAIVSDIDSLDMEALGKFAIENAVASVTTKQPNIYEAEGETNYRVTLIDYGCKRNIVGELQARGCEVRSVPYNTSAEEILADNPDGIMLSNGPGNPIENAYSIEQLGKLMGKKPIFGICLGHQLLALANGWQTVKMKYGHRGANQPAKDLRTGKLYITSQNHAYTVMPKPGQKGKLCFTNANDETCEGIEYAEQQAFSVQFHPEANAGPKDTAFLFDRFLGYMEENKSCR